MNLSITDLKVLRLYSKNLAYHSVHHPLEMLELHLTGSTRGIAIPQYQPVWLADHAERASLISAIVAHDVVYVPGAPKGQNELKSYETWLEVSKSRPNAFMESLIMSTSTHNPDSVAVASLQQREIISHLIDLDMSALGTNREEFDRNSDNVAQEFMTLGYTREQCRAGRLKFFESVLKQDRIFFTKQFHSALEEKARRNMIEDINAGGSVRKTMLVDTPGGQKTADIIGGEAVIVQG